MSFGSRLARAGSRRRSVVRRASSSSTDPAPTEGEDWARWEYGTFNANGAKVNRSARSLRARKENMDPLWRHVADEEIERAIAVLQPLASAERRARFESALAARTDRFRFVFENPSNPNNLWAALRTFDAFGVQCVDIVVPDNAKSKGALSSTNATSTNDVQERERDGESVEMDSESDAPRSTMTSALGAQKWLTLRGHSSAAACVSSLRSEGYVVIVTDIHEGALRLPEIDWNALQSKHGATGTTDAAPKVAIVMGNELTGISEEMRRLADHSFYIPMRGFAESLNLSVACAVICATLDSQRLLGHGIADAQLRQRVLFSWLTRTVKASLSILRRHGIKGIEKSDQSVYNSIGSVTTRP